MQNGLPVRLLGLLAGGGIRSLNELARRLDVSEDLTRLMAEDLTRRGYLAPLGGSCTTTCEGCALSNACGSPGASAPPLLGLTPKGHAAVTAANAAGRPIDQNRVSQSADGGR